MNLASTRTYFGFQRPNKFFLDGKTPYRSFRRLKCKQIVEERYPKFVFGYPVSAEKWVEGKLKKAFLLFSIFDDFTKWNSPKDLFNLPLTCFSMVFQVPENRVSSTYSDTSDVIIIFCCVSSVDCGVRTELLHKFCKSFLNYKNGF